jgi:hypothetical protein
MQPEVIVNVEDGMKPRAGETALCSEVVATFPDAILS